MAHKFLLVDDHPSVMRFLATYFGRFGSVITASTLAEGFQAFAANTDLRGVVVDVSLPDGFGTDLVQHIRERDPTLPILMLTGGDERDWANKAHLLGVEFIFKPAGVESLGRFCAGALAKAAFREDGLARVVSDLVCESGLSPREVQVLTLALAGTQRAALNAELGVSDNTVKTTVRRLLRKTKADTLDDLVKYVMRVALQQRVPVRINGETAPD